MSRSASPTNAATHAAAKTATRGAPEAAPDGRALRSERSREAIVRAVVDLVGEGSLQPTAEQVAERAGVGLRTVFRHFTDMESLFAAMQERLQAELAPLLRAAGPEGDRERRARELVQLRATFFERLAPYRRAALLKYRRSEFLRSEHEKLVRALRSDLLRWLPELEKAPADLVEAVDVATSIETWMRLRGEQDLSRGRAIAAIERTVLALLRSG